MPNKRSFLTLLFLVLAAPRVALAQQPPAPVDPNAPPAQQPTPAPGSVVIGPPEPGASPWGTQPQPGVGAPPAPVAQQPPPGYGGYGYPAYPPPPVVQPMGPPQPYYAMSAGEMMRVDRARSNRRLISGGAAIFGAFYVVTLVMALFQLSETTYGTDSIQTEGYINLVPVAGPYINAVRVATSHTDGGAVLAFLYILDGVAQTAGLAMIIGGVARNSSPANPPGQPPPRTASRSFDWHLVPAAAGASAGASFVARF